VLTLLSVTPEDGELNADIADVEALWESDDEDDPIVSIVIEKDSMSYPVVFFYQGSGRIIGKANVGLYPNDLNVIMHTDATTLLGLTDSFDWAFSCRGPIEAPPSSALIEKDRGTIVYGVGDLYSSSLGLQAPSERTSLLVTPIISIERQVLEILVVHIVGFSEFVTADISATRQIEQLLALNALATSNPVNNIGQVALVVEDQVFGAGSMHGTVMTLVDGLSMLPGIVSVGLAFPNVWVVVVTAAAAKGSISTVLNMLELVSGDGFHVFIDAVDVTLGEVR
jgi:hypothetical protein